MAVSREDVNAIAMPSSRPLLYHRLFSAEEVEGLLEGFKPRSMDDRWFFFAEDGVVHLHRSWTGQEIYSFRVSRLEDETGKIVEIRVNNAYPHDQDARQQLNLLFEKILPRYYGG